MPPLALEGVSKRFGGVLAVSDVSILIPPGRVTGLIGPNGAGKTTLVNLITGMLKLSTGRIRIGDTDISKTLPYQIARLGISRTYQNIRLLTEATVIENVMIGFHRHEKASMLAGMLSLPRSREETRALRERAVRLLQRFQMERFADYPAGALAYGHQRRVEMMRAVALEPSILLLDEPVAGMNDVEAADLGCIFQELAESGIGLLLIEHNVRFVTRMSHEIYVLDAGRIISSGTAQTVLKEKAVIAAYLGTR